MSLSSDFYEEQRKKKKQTSDSSVNQGSGSASSTFLQNVKSGAYKTPSTTKIKVEQPSLVEKKPEKKKASGGFIEGVRQIGQSFVVGVKEAIGSLQGGAGVLTQELVKLREKNIKKYGTIPGSQSFEEKAKELRSKGKIKEAEEYEAFIKKSEIEAGKTTKFLSDTAKKLKDSSIKTFQDAQAYERVNLPIENQKSLQEGIKDPLWISKTVVRSVPSILTSLGVSAATLAVTKNPSVALTVGYGTTFSQNAGFAYQDAKSFDASEDIAQKSAATVGTWAGLLDMLPIGRLLSRTPQGQIIKRSVVKEMVKSFVIQAGLEASTESGQEIISNAVAKAYDENRDFFQNVPESFFVGGLLGGVIGGVTDVATGILTPDKSAKELKDKIKQIKNTPEEERTKEDKEFLAAAEDQSDIVIPPIEFLGEEGTTSQTSQTSVREVGALPENLPPVVSEALTKRPSAQEQEVTVSKEATFYRGVADETTALTPSEDTAASYGKGIYLTENPTVAKDFGENIVEIYTKKDLKLYTPTEEQRLEIIDLSGKAQEDYIKNLLGDKYDGLRIVKPDYYGDAAFPEIVIYNKEILETKPTEGTVKPITVKDTDELLTYIDRQGFRTPEQIATLRADIIKNGIKYPIELIDNGDGTFDINDGTHRIQIAKDLGIKKLPFKVTHKRDEQGIIRPVKEKGTTLPSQEGKKQPSQPQKKEVPTGGVGEGTIEKRFDKKGREIGTKKPTYNTKASRASQASFIEKIDKIGSTAVSQQDLISKVEPYIDEQIKLAGDNKETLKGLRTALNKEMFGYVGSNGSYKADYAELKLMMESPDIGDYLQLLEDKIFEIDEKLSTGDASYSSSKASIGDYADLKNRTTEIKDIPAVEFPEIVKIAKTLMGEYPVVKTPRFRPSLGGTPRGVFFAKENGKIVLNPDIFKDPVQAAKTLAHEIGHLVDYLPDKTMARGNLLGRIASLNKYMKTMLREFPGSEGELLTAKEKAKIRRAAEKEGRNTYEIITKEIEVGTEPTNPEEILSIWRDATSGIKNKELLAYIQGLSDAKKKELAINAMRGKVPEWVDFVHSVKKTITQKVLKNSPSDIRKIYQRMLKEEIVKRHFFDLLTIKKELQVLSNKWRPANLNLAPEGYLKYRRDPAELYADAISVLFNDPVLLKEEAPTFWKAFFNYLDVKPEVKEALFSTYNLLNKGEEAVFQQRQADVEQMFDNSEQQFTAKHLEKQKEKTNLIYTLRLLFDSKNTPLKRKVNKARKEGKLIDSNLNPVFAYEGLSYMDGKLEDFVQKNYQPIFEKAQKISDDGWAKLGSILLYERSMNERGELANPLGYSPKTAQDQLTGLQKSMTPQDWQAMQDVLKSFREATNKITKMAEDSEFYSPELLKQMKANNSYATYQVIDYLDTYVSAHVYKSIGTLKEIANPATSTVMKGISVVKAIERNNAKKIAVDFFKKNFPDDIQPAKSVFKGKRMEFIESKDPDLRMIKLIENGKMTAYYVEKDLADNINNTSNETIIKTAKIMRVLTGAGIYRPLFTSLNLGFSTFNFVRDFQRYWSNVPDYTLGQAITSLPRVFYRYGQAIPAASRRARKKLDPTISAMKELNIIGSSYNGVFEHQEVDPEDMQIERIMKQYGLLEKTKKKKIFTPIFNILDTIEAFNTFVETLPKVAGYIELKNSGRMTDLEMADFLRTKVGSPNFRSKGQLTPVTNSVFLFSNAIKEGIKSDIQVATGKAGKQSAAGFWWKTTASVFLPSMLMFAAMSGLFGKWLEDRFKDISEYDKTNFTIIPTGVDKDGKTTYLRIPRAETQRFMGGLLWKIMRNANRKDLKLEDIFDVFDYGAGQLPNLTPAWTGGGALLTYLSGHNPYDAFRHRNIIPDTEFNAGFKYSFPKFIDWFVKNQGAGIILPSFLDKNPTELQKSLALPFISNVVGRWFKVSDYGQTEENKRITENIEREKAKKTLDTREKLDAAVKEYQSGSQSYTRRMEIKRKLIKDTLGVPKTSDEKAAAKRLEKKFEVAIIRGSGDPLTDSVIDANTNDEKVELIYAARDKLGTRYKDYIRDLQIKKVISEEVAKELLYVKK